MTDKTYALEVPGSQLNLDYTLLSGQVFHWSRDENGGWHGAVGDTFVKCHRQDENRIEVTLSSEQSPEDTTDSLIRFFRLDSNLQKIKYDLSCRDARLESVFDAYPGLRLLQQNPFHCLVGFICSVVTNIPRIRLSITELCRRFGSVDGYCCTFPSLTQLAEASPSELRVGAMEFRARTLSAVCHELLARGGVGYLESLRTLTFEEAHQQLDSLPGIGPKIADCVLLFSLGFDIAFPLDTHTWRVADQWFGIGAGRSVKDYREASARLRDHFGPFAGWAQQYLYFDQLRKSSRDPLKNLEK